MAEHPPTSIDNDYERLYYDSILSSRTESLKSSVFTPKYIYKSVLLSGDTTPLEKKPKNPKSIQ